VIPAVRLEEERPRLRPLKIAPADLVLRVPVVVGPTAEVLHDTHTYSMAADAIGMSATPVSARASESRSGAQASAAST
jgi:hypothetical protein